MNFAWDPEKSETNFIERGFDFEFATRIFEGPTLERTDRFGESEDTRRIISARRSSRREREAYENIL